MNTDISLSSSPTWLPTFPGLSELKDKSWQDASHAASEFVIPAGTVVVRKGDPCQNFLLIQQGSIRAYDIADNGREIVLFRVSAGEMCILTITNLLEETAYSANAVTESEVRAIAIPIEHFKTVMSRSSAFRKLIMSTLVRRMSDIMRLVQQVTFHRLDLRLACLLGKFFGDQRAMIIQVTHDQLAKELGTKREVVSRLLKEFERMGCIRLHRGQIELVSEDALNKLTAEVRPQ
jgi:CRP/FNR family transcriptional regulator, anaerobic regulatory protein